MSLINTMLQELDARRSESSGGSPFGQQVRAVPKRRSVHPAWWLVLVLAVILSGVLAWVVLRPPAPAQSGTEPRLPLKLDIDLSVAPTGETSSLPMNGGQVVSTSAPAATLAKEVATNTNAYAPTHVDPGVAISPVAARVPEKTSAAPKPSKAVEPAASQPVPDIPQVASTHKVVTPAGQTRLQESAAPLAINKQVKEMSAHQRAENEFRKALGLMQQGRNAEAIHAYEEALKLDPQHAEARHSLIGALLAEKRQDDALQKAKEALERDPAQPALAMILARLQLEKGELRKATESLEKTLPYAAQRPDYHAFLAALLQRDERHTKAIEHYLIALQKSPQNGLWWMGLGISFQAEQRNAEAIEAFKRAKASNALSAELLAFVDGRLAQLQR